MHADPEAVRARWAALVAAVRPVCSRPGCELPVQSDRSRGLCSAHYREWRSWASYATVFTRRLRTEDITPPGWKMEG